MKWARLITALCDVESAGHADAVGDNGAAIGVLQMHPEVIIDVNAIYGTQFTYDDRHDIDKSKAIFVMYVTWYCRYERLGGQPTMRDYALCWHYGPSFLRMNANGDTDRDGYWDRVLKHI